MMSEPFELFALRYATSGPRRQSENLLGGDPHEAGEPLDYFVWVARRSDRVFVIDTGFGPAAAAHRGRTLIERPADMLAAIGIDAATVDDVILTHLHYDHAGTLGDFPAARLHVQDSEVAYATGRSMCHHALRHSYDVEDVVTLVRRVHAGRVTFHDGVVALADGLTVHRIPGHTPGLQAVRVWTARGWVLLASDATHFYANMDRGMPFPVVDNIAATLEGHRLLHTLAETRGHIIPGHDPLVMRMFPPLSVAFEGRIARLDVTGPLAV